MQPESLAAVVNSEPSPGNPQSPFYAYKQGGDWALFSREYASAHRGRIKVRGFINSGFLNGYVDRIEGAILWVMLSNNPDHCLPVMMPLTQMKKNNLTKHQPVAIQYTVSGKPTTSAAKSFYAEAALRFASSIENLALPLASAFRKPPAPSATAAVGAVPFEPFGSGIRLTGDPNRIFLAGIIAGIRTARYTQYDEAVGSNVEITPFSEVLLRQDDNPTNKIPVRIYRQLHQQIVANAKLGDPVFVEAQLKITWVDVLDQEGVPIMLPSGAKKRTCMTFLQAEGLLVAQPIHIMGLPDEEKLPSWAQDIRRATQSRRRASSNDVTRSTRVESRTLSFSEWLLLPTAVERFAHLKGIFDDLSGAAITPQEAIARLSEGDRNALRTVADRALNSADKGAPKTESAY